MFRIVIKWVPKKIQHLIFLQRWIVLQMFNGVNNKTRYFPINSNSCYKWMIRIFTLSMIHHLLIHPMKGSLELIKTLILITSYLLYPKTMTSQLIISQLQQLYNRFQCSQCSTGHLVTSQIVMIIQQVSLIHN